jgi:hypothetical protein
MEQYETEYESEQEELESEQEELESEQEEVEKEELIREIPYDYIEYIKPLYKNYNNFKIMNFSNKEINQNSEIKIFLKPIIKNVCETDYLYFQHKYYLNKFVEEYKNSFHEVILENFYIKPYFDFDNGELLEDIINLIKETMLILFNKEIKDEEFIIYGRIDKDSKKEKYHILLNYKIWANTFKIKMKEYNNINFDNNVYKKNASLRNPYSLKIDLYNEKTKELKDYYKGYDDYKTGYYIVKETRYNRIQGKFCHENNKLYDSLIGYTKGLKYLSEEKIIFTEEKYKESNKKIVPKIVTELMKEKIEELEKKLSIQISGKERKGFIKINKCKYELHFTDAFGINGPIQNKWYKCLCPNKCILQGNGFIDIKDVKYYLKTYQEGCQGFEIKNVSANDDCKLRMNEIVNQMKEIQDKQFTQTQTIRKDFEENCINLCYGLPGNGKTYSILNKLKETNRTNIIIVCRQVQATSIQTDLKEIYPESQTIIINYAFDNQDIKNFKNIIVITNSLWKLRDIINDEFFNLNNCNLFIDEFIQYLGVIVNNYSNNNEQMFEIRDFIDNILIKESNTIYISDVIYQEKCLLQFFNFYKRKINLIKFDELRERQNGKFKYENLIISNKENLLEDKIKYYIENDIPLFIWSTSRSSLISLYEHFFEPLINQEKIKKEDVLLLTRTTDINIKQKNYHNTKFILASPLIFSAISIGKNSSLLNENKRVTIAIHTGKSIKLYDFINSIQRVRHGLELYIFSPSFKSLYNFYNHSKINLENNFIGHDKDYDLILKTYSVLNWADCLNHIPYYNLLADIDFENKFNPPFLQFKKTSKDYLSQMSPAIFNTIKEYCSQFDFDFGLDKFICSDLFSNKNTYQPNNNNELFNNTHEDFFTKINDIKQEKINIKDKENNLSTEFVDCLKFITENIYINNIDVKFKTQLDKILFNFHNSNYQMGINSDRPFNFYDGNLYVKYKHEEDLNKCQNLINSFNTAKKNPNYYNSFFIELTNFFNNHSELTKFLIITKQGKELTNIVNYKKNQYETKEIINPFIFDSSLTQLKYKNKEIQNMNDWKVCKYLINFVVNSSSDKSRINMTKCLIEDFDIKFTESKEEFINKTKIVMEMDD